MQTPPFNCELFATRLSDPKLTSTLKTKIALELRDSQELFHVAENPTQLSILIPSLLSLLEDEPPSFSQKAYEQKLRCTILEILNRLPFNEALRFQAQNISKTLFQILKTDNEDNALASLKILVDMFRCYRNDLGNAIVLLFEAIRDIYANMESVVRDLFDNPGTPANSTGVLSFKLLIECPTLLKPLGGSHKELMAGLASLMLPTALDFLKLQAAPQLEARQLEHANGKYFVGVSSAIKNTAAFSDFVMAQIKTLGFLTVLHRNSWVNLKPVIGEVFEISLRLLCDCPTDLSSSKRDIFVSMNYLLCVEIRPHFLNNINLLMTDQVMDWAGATSRESLKCLSYTVLADLLLFFRSDLSFDTLTRATLQFIRGLHDNHLNYSMQKVCIRLLSGLAECICKCGERPKARILLMHILNAYAVKLESTLTGENIEDFDFEKIRPLWMGTKGAQNAVELLKEARIFFRFLASCLDPLVTSMIATNPTDLPADCVRGLTADDTQLLARLYRDTLKCLGLFSLDRKEPPVLPLRARDGSNLCADAPEAQEVARALILLFHKADLAVFHDVVHANLDFFFERFLENAQLGVLPKLLLANERLGGPYLAILLGFLVDRLPLLAVRDCIFCSRFLHLFGLAFQAVSINPAHEHLLAPHLGQMVRACFDYPPQSTEGSHHYLLLSVLFNNLALASLERSHAEVTQLLPGVVTDLLLALSTTSYGDVRDLLLELLLQAYATVAYMTPLVHYVMRPIILSLNAGPHLASKALLTLETALDTVARELLDPVLELVADQLLYGVTKHLRPLPYDAVLSTSAARVLGKLGAVNRAFLLHPRAQSLKGCDFAALLEFDGRSQSFPLELSQLITLAYNVLHDPTADLFYRSQALKLSRSCLALFVDIDRVPALPEDLLGLRGGALICLQNGPEQALEAGAETRFLPAPDSRAIDQTPGLRREQRASQGAALQKVLAAILVAATYPELRGEAMPLMEGLMAHLALIKVIEVLGARPELAGEMVHRTAHAIDSEVLTDLLVDAITDSNVRLRQLGINLLLQLENNCVQLLGGRQYLSRLPVFAQICDRLSACCYQEDWIRKERSYIGLTLMVIRLDLGREWLQRHEPRIVASLLYVLKATASTAHYDNIWSALQQIITKAHEFEEGVDRTVHGTRLMQLAGRVLGDLFSANNSLRTAVKAILQLCVRLSGVELAALLQPFALQLHNFMFVRPMRSLPIALMVGAFDAIAFLLDARPAFIRGEDHLVAFIAECLALLDSEDAAFKTRDERLMVRFRVKCMGVIMAALSFVENIAHPNIMRARAIRVFFKFLHSDNLEMADAASLSLKQLMSHQNKLPKDLLQDVLKPYLTSISDSASMTMAHLKGLARLLEILTHYFKVEIGTKLLDSLKYRARLAPLDEAAEAYLPDHEAIRMLAAVLNVFSFLPPSGKIFLKDLVPATLDLERQLRRCLGSPFRAPLMRFMAKHPSEAIQYFYEHLGDERYSHFLLAAINADPSGTLRKEVMTHPEQLITYAFDSPAHRTHFVAIVRAICHAHGDWLVRTPAVLDRLVAMWRSPDWLQNGSALSLAQQRETQSLCQILIVASTHDPSRIDLLVDLAGVLSLVTSADLSPVRHYFRTLALLLAPAQRRAIMAHFLKLPSETPAAHLATLLHHLINPMLLVACVRGGNDQFMDCDLVSQLHTRVWEGPLARVQDNYLRLGTIQLTTLLLQYTPRLLEGSMKEVIRFGSAYLRVDDMVCRQAAHLLLARFIAAFGSTDNIIMVLYSALLKTTVLETKPMVRLALDALVAVFPSRPARQGDDPRFPMWIRFTKQCLGEEVYKMSHMINIFQFMGRHPAAFFEYRKHFIPQMVYILPKLGLQDTNPDSKGLLIQLADMLLKWETLQSEGEEPRAKRAKGLVPEPPKDLTPLMKDIVVAALVRLFCSCGDPILRKQFAAHALDAIRGLLSLPSWADVSVSPSLFEEVLRVADSEERLVSAIFALELLYAVVVRKPASWVRVNLRGLRECLATCIRLNHYTVSCALHPVLSAIFSAEVGGDPELMHLQALVEESVQKGLADNTTMGSALTLLDTVRQAEAVDAAVPTLTRLFQRLAKEHTNPALAERRAPQTPSHMEQLRIMYPALAASSMPASPDSNSNSLLLALNVLKRRISHLGDYRKPLLSSMGQLLERSHDHELLRSLFRVVTEWLLRGSESFPTTKEKANLLVSMVEMAPRCDHQLLADYLQLILDIYEDKNLAHTELTAKLEPAFMLGTRTDVPSTRSRFLALLDDSIPRPLPLRLKYILGVHDWERLASNYWIPQATYLLIGALRLGSPLRAAPLSLTLPTVCPPTMASCHPSGEFDAGLQNQLSGFWATLKTCSARDLVLPAQHLAALDPTHHSELWGRVFAGAWSNLSEVERSDTVKLLIALLSKPYHLNQADATPNVVQALLLGLRECRPYVVLPPQLVKYLAANHRSWFESIGLLDGALLAIDANPDKDDALIRSSVEDALSDLFSQLGQYEDFHGLWARRCKYPTTGVAIKLTQLGLWGPAQAAFEQAQSLASKSVLPSCESEYCVWESQWVYCTERLQQWDLLQDLGEAAHCPELHLRATWHNLGFNADVAPFQALLAQVDPVAIAPEVTPAFAPQLRLFHALAALGKAPEGLAEALSSFATYSQLAHQEIAARWCLLPRTLSEMHLPLLAMCHQLTEASLVPSLLNQLASADQTLADQTNHVDRLFTLWRSRMPRPWDPLAVWAEVGSWRKFIYGTLARFIQRMPSTEASAGTPPASLLQRCYDEQAWVLNEFARAARVQRQYRVCIDKLSRHYEFPNLRAEDAFVKLMEHARCYYAMPGELERGLAMLNRANPNHFSAKQRAEFFALKGQCLAKLHQLDEANQAFSTATQNGVGVAETWGAWGQYNEDRFLARNEMELGVYALNCYIQAAGLHRNHQSRRYIAKTIYLLNLDDAQGSLAESFEPHKASLPLWYWIFFVPQLLNGMTQRSAPLIKFILLQIAKWHPQCLYFNLSTAREEYSILRSLAKPSDGEDSDSDVYKQAWDCLSDVVDSIKIHMPLFSMSAVIFTEALANCPRPTPAEELYQLTSMLVDEAITLLCSRATHGESPLAPYSFPRLASCAKALPEGRVREAFEAEFTRPPPSLMEFVTRMRRWRDRCETLLPRQTKQIFLDTFSPAMVNAEASGLNDLLIPGQYIVPAEEARELIRVSRFLPRVQVIYRHNVAHHKLTIRGHNGDSFAFLLQHDATHISRREERVAQLAHCINRILLRNERTAHRRLQFHLPHLIPLGHALRMVQCREDYASLYEMYDEGCSRSGTARDLPYLHHLKRLQEVPVKSPAQMLNLRQEIFFEITRLIPPPWRRTTSCGASPATPSGGPSEPTSRRSWGWRRQMLVALPTGDLWLQESVPTLNQSMPTLQANDPVPFRLTPALQELVTRRGLDGLFSTAIVTSARALVEPLAFYLPLFMRDEYLFWMTFKKTLEPAERPASHPAPSPKLDPTFDPLKGSHAAIQRLVAEVSGRLTTLACDAEPDNPPKPSTPLDLPVAQLISVATNPQPWNLTPAELFTPDAHPIIPRVQGYPPSRPSHAGSTRRPKFTSARIDSSGIRYGLIRGEVKGSSQSLDRGLPVADR
ncbi:transcription-associated protein 1 [Massospora cicadina]|nr:transcription-associated protein 1 [Massospora cicadina]